MRTDDGPIKNGVQTMMITSHMHTYLGERSVRVLKALRHSNTRQFEKVIACKPSAVVIEPRFCQRPTVKREDRDRKLKVKHPAAAMGNMHVARRLDVSLLRMFAFATATLDAVHVMLRAHFPCAKCGAGATSVEACRLAAKHRIMNFEGE